MYKSYNNFEELSSKFVNFLKVAIPNIRKTQLNVLPIIIIGMLLAESCVALDIAKKLANVFSFIKLDSIIKRIRRFFSNNLFNPYDFYKSLITYIIKSFKCKHNDNTLYITFDHMFSKGNYTVFMMTLRIGTFGIPIYFRCFKDISNNDAFKFNTMKDGIQAVSDLFKDSGFNLVFLADRWFGSPKILSFIESLGHIYCVRIKGNTLVYKDNEKSNAKKLKHRKYVTVAHKDVFITNKRYKTNIVYSSTYGTKDPWIIATNGDTNKAIKNYSYRFGSIEMMFKSQKSNGFNLEKVSNASLEAFTTMYTCVCVCVLYSTILGADYSKNSKCYKNVEIETHKNYNVDGKKVRKRTMSLFNTGLTLFSMAYNSLSYIRIPFTFKLYDV